MKTIWIAVVLLVVVLVGATTLFVYTSFLYGDLQESLARMRQAVEDENWDAATNETGRLNEIWTRADAAWSPIMDHRQVDRLDESITRILRLTELRMREELLVEIAVASRLTRRLKDTEIPNLRNVF